MCKNTYHLDNYKFEEARNYKLCYKRFIQPKEVYVNTIYNITPNILHISSFTKLFINHDNKFESLFGLSNNDYSDYSSSSEEEYDYTYAMNNRIGVRTNRGTIITSIGEYYSEQESDYEDEIKDIKSIGKKEIITFSNINKYSIFCSICQETQLDTVKIDCNHHFCEECIREYLKLNNRCPNCKREIYNLYKINVLPFE